MANVIRIMATLTIIMSDGSQQSGGVISLQLRSFAPNEKHPNPRAGFGHYGKLTIDGVRYQCTDNWVAIDAQPAKAHDGAQPTPSGTPHAGWTPPTLPDPNRGNEPIDGTQIDNSSAVAEGVKVTTGIPFANGKQGKRGK